jgi:putative endonuclease
MPYFVYIIQSETTGRYYCGYSSDPERRLRQHNDPQYQLSQTTKRFEGPWKLIWSRECETRAQAMALEKAIKKRGIQRFLYQAQPAESRPGGINHARGVIRSR